MVLAIEVVGALTAVGLSRVTLSTPEKRDHVHSKNRVPLVGDDVDDVYSRNIQVVELNALNAALAVIKYKKYFDFYCDLDNEHFSVYTLDGNAINNEDKV